MLNRLKALILLSECTGDDLWSMEHCRQRGVPEQWLVELGDCFESGFDRDENTIYLGTAVTNQYHGIRDVDLAFKLGRHLGFDVQALLASSHSRAEFVLALKAVAEEG
jgi:hypothetical protein